MKAGKLRDGLKERLWRRFAACRPSEACGMVIWSVIVGLGTAVGVWLFKLLIKGIHSIVHGAFALDFHSPGPWTALVAPLVGGLAVGLLACRFLPRERLHGVAGVIHSVAVAGGRLPYRETPLKTAAAALSIGSGASVARKIPRSRSARTSARSFQTSRTSPMQTEKLWWRRERPRALRPPSTPP